MAHIARCTALGAVRLSIGRPRLVLIAERGTDVLQAAACIECECRHQPTLHPPSPHLI